MARTTVMALATSIALSTSCGDGGSGGGSRDGDAVGSGAVVDVPRAAPHGGATTRTAAGCLLDDGTEWRIVRHPPIPAEDPASPSGSVTIPPDAWSAPRELPAGLRAELGSSPNARVWRARPIVAITSRTRVLHRGRRLAASPRAGGSSEWVDDAAGLRLWWEREGGTLRALGDSAPGEIVLWTPRTDGAARPDDEPAVADSRVAGEEEDESRRPAAAPGASVAPRSNDRPPREAGELLRRMALGRTSRWGFHVAAPSELSCTLDPLDGVGLDLTVGVDERLLSRMEGRLGHAVQRKRPMTFAVEVDDGGGRRRLWSRTLAAEDGFVDAFVDLGDLSGRRLTLHLVTEAAGAREAVWFSGLWSGLRVRPAGAGGRPPDAVLVLVDTLRADRVGCLGAARDTTPRIDAWARDAVVYVDAVAPSNWTLPSTATLLTGLAVHQHGMVDGGRVLPEPASTLASRLRAAGYETRAIVEGGYVSEAFGFARGFDAFTQLPSHQPDWEPALSWIAERPGERPYFLLLHTYLVHAPWSPDERFVGDYDGPLAGRAVDHAGVIGPFEAGALELDEADRAYVRALYDAAVHRADALVGHFLAGLERVAEDGERLVVVTSDHGEELFERGLVEHGRSLYGELLRVPLLVRYPGQRQGRRDPRPVSGLDVAPTVLDVAGLPAPPDMPGRSLLDLDDAPRLRVSQHGAAAHATHLDGWKLISGDFEDPVRGDDVPELYELAKDGRERHDRAETEARRVGQLAARLADYLEEHAAAGDGASVGDLDPRVLDDLRALGYVGDR